MINIDELAQKWLKERNLLNLEYSHIKLLGFLSEEISEGVSRMDDAHESVDWRVDCMIFIIHSLVQDGYSPSKCLEQGYKEILSRKGHIGKDGKWYKDKSVIGYKADYSVAIR